ncbi:MAG: ferrous iron transport protein B [Bacteroidales bacterium]|jgi:ferrous iron transport protein B|nr:ferrous iron transport protein B [Bacteroidales bacterium]
MNLSEVNQGQKVRIVRVKGRSAFRHRITEMGFVKGQTVEVIRYAPMKDPIVFKILGSEISLRIEEAKWIEVENFSEIIYDKTAIKNDIKFCATQSECDICAVQNNCDTCNTQIVCDTCETQSTCDKKNNDRHKRNKISVCMVGNPNAGKTSVYNMLSGQFEHVGNYGGVTVDEAVTTFFYNNYEIEITDLPGSYSLSPYSPEERFVRDTLLKKQPDIVLNVIDASNIERNLYLTTQLIDMDLTLLIALNMSDEMEKQGAKLDDVLLGNLLGTPVVRTVARVGAGKEILLDKIVKIYSEQEPTVRHIHIPYGEDVENDIRELQAKILADKKYIDVFSSRYIALKMLEDDVDAVVQMNCIEDIIPIKALAEAKRVKLREVHEEEPDQILSNSRYAFVNGALKETYIENTRLKNKKQTVNQKIDAVLTHKIWGFPIFLLFLWVMFETTFTIGQFPMDWIDRGVLWLYDSLSSSMHTSIIKDLVLDGVLKGIGGVIIFLPNILILFFFISLMEASGYMARVAFIMDKLMHTIGLHGKSFVPLIIGFGCNVPAIMATRTIENRKDRLVTMLIIPFMSCSARLPVFILLVGAFFSASWAGTIIFLIYLTGIVISILSALFFHKVLLRHEESPFVMEMPPYRIPTMRFVGHSLWLRTRQYLQKIGGTILILSIVIWVLGYFPRIDNVQQVSAPVETSAPIETSAPQSAASERSVEEQQEVLVQRAQLEQSYLGKIGRFIEPVIKPLGFDWKMGICLLAGISAKEVVVSTMNMLLDVPHTFTSSTALAFIAFILLYMPCIAVFSAVRKESESWRWSIFMAFYTTGVAYLVALLITQISRLF